MKLYHFALHQGGVQIEELGTMTLADDTAALAFGERLARDLERHQDGSAGRSIAILDGMRTVQSIPLN